MLIDSGTGADPEHLAERLHVLSNEALKDVKLSLKLRGWFTSNQTLVRLAFRLKGMPSISDLQLQHLCTTVAGTICAASSK